MIIQFRQGIASYPTSSGQQVFLTRVGSYVNLQTANGKTDVAFAHGASDYLYTESIDTNNAWGPLASLTEYWLYWDINKLTAIRTFGFTTLAPTFGISQPVGIEGLHWFNTITNKMYVFNTGRWVEVIRVFAAKVNTNNTFSSLGNLPGSPYAGSQVSVNTPNTAVGHIIADTAGNPIRRSNGTFFTVEDHFFVNGSPINTQRLESSIVNAAALESIAQFQVVKFSQFGEVSLATYNDIQNTIIAMSFENLGINDIGDFCVQGVVNNPSWNFQNVGVDLWVTGSGILTEVDPHVLDPIAYPYKKVPIARVLSPTSIYFDQGMGGIGPTGLSGVLATNVVYGISKLSVAAVNAVQPIVVGDNDPRLQKTLDDLTDVIVPTPTPGDLLEWNGTNWANNSTLAIANGGTGQATAPTAINALLPSQLNNFNKVLSTDGVNISWGLYIVTGQAVLVGGTATVSNGFVFNTSNIILTSQIDGGGVGFLRVSSRVAGVSFTITSSSATDTSTVAWVLIN